jgi:hypothetical protein
LTPSFSLENGGQGPLRFRQPAALALEGPENVPVCELVSWLNCTTKAFHTGNAGTSALLDGTGAHGVPVRLALMPRSVPATVRCSLESFRKVCGKIREKPG